MKVLMAGKSLKELSYCKSHRHECWEIVVVLSGEGQVKTKKESLDFSKGTVYVMPPYTDHELLSDTSFSDMYIHIDNLDFDKNKMTAVFNNDDFAVLGNLLYDMYLKRGHGYRYTLRNITETIVQLILDSISEKNRFPFTRGIRDYIDDHIADNTFSMATLSALTKYDPDYVRRCFKADYNVTPMEYLSSLRISYAKKLLTRMKTYKISEVAELCGFSDQLYFSRCFKKMTGVSPLEYRKQA